MESRVATMTVGVLSSFSKLRKPILALVIIVLIVVVGVTVYYQTRPVQTPVTVSSTSATSVLGQAQNSSVFVDDYMTALFGVFDSMDPAVGFTAGDAPLFTATYQQLVGLNGSDATHVVPQLASNYSVENNYQTFVFTIRQGVTFSNGDPFTASVAWFSFAREMLIGQGPGVADYVELLFPANFSAVGYALPWGVGKAINAATGLPTNTDPTLAANALANILSNFDPSNATIKKVMSYPNQALVVLNSNSFEINLLTPYRDFLLCASLWWGAMQDPAFIDAHGGVQPNAVNSYLTNTPEPTTGPYTLVSYTPGTQAVLHINPTYWGNSIQGLPVINEPAHIPIIIINEGESLNNRMQGFIHNSVQLSYVEPGSLSQVFSSYQTYSNSSSYFVNTGPSWGTNWLSFNTQKPPMNNTDLRLALVHAVNYTSIIHDVCKNLCVSDLGPISPYFTGIYNPGNLPPYSYNLTLAEQYMNESGWEGHFNVVLPDGTVLGNPSANQLSPLTITAPAPLTQFEQSEFSVIQSGWQQIGVAVSLQAQAESVFFTPMATMAGTPQIALSAWFPDWPDGIFWGMVSLTGSAGGTGGNFAWWFNPQLLTMYQTLPFETDQTRQLQMVTEGYKVIYDNAPYLWLPDYDVYFLVQPYVKGFVYNPAFYYLYNSLYYSTG